MGKSSKKCKIVGFKDKESRLQPNECGQILAAREGKEMDFPLEPLEINTVLQIP